MTGKRFGLILLFLAVYLSWDAYALVYPFIGRWSADVTQYLLKLPLTSYSFEYSLVSWTVSHHNLHALMRAVYKAGFAGSFWLPALYSHSPTRSGRRGSPSSSPSASEFWPYPF